MPSDPSARRPRRTVRLGKYEVISHVASGGMGAVYRAIDTALKREVALKVLPPSMAAQPQALERFRREAQNAAKLRHENIVTIYEFAEAGGTYYLAMEFVEGIDLQEYIDRKGRVEPEEARLIAIQAAHALAHAHGQGVIHRDVKPSNFLVSRKGDRLIVKMSDFGLARGTTDEEARVTRDGHTVGTVDYIAPEQARDSRKADARSDVYSLGCTLFHMLAGRPPFPGGSIPERLFKHANQEAPDLRLISPGVSEAFCAVVRRMLAKDPAERYQTPTALLKDLVRIESAAAPLSGRDMLAGLAFAADEGPANEPEEDEAPAPPPRRAPRAAAPAPPKRGPRRGESEPTEEVEAPAEKKSPLSGAGLWLLAGGVALVGLGVAVVAVGLRSPPRPRDFATAVAPPPVVFLPDDTPRGPGPAVRSQDTAKAGPAPAKPEWPALYQPSTPLAREPLTADFLGPWAQFAEPGPAVPVLRVSRLPSGEGAFASLDAACAAAAASQLTVIEIQDNGPIFQPSVAVADRSLVLRAGKGYRPLLVWDAERTRDEGRGTKDGPATFLRVTHGNLTLERLDVVGKWTDAAAASGRPCLVRVTDGDLLARDCTFSTSVGQPPEMGVVRFDGTAAARCRLSRCVARGPGLVALDVACPGADVLLDGCLVVGTDRPLVQAAGHNAAPLTLRLLRSTLVCTGSMLRVHPATANDTRPAVHVRGWDALLARGGTGSGGQMVVVSDDAEVSGMTWEAVNCLYAGWQTLLSAGRGGAADLRAWQIGWQHSEGDVAVAPPWPAVVRHDPGEAAAADFRPAPAPASPVGYGATSGPGPLGCDPAALPPARTGWLALTYESYPEPELATINDDAAPPVPVSDDGRYHGGRIDLGQVRDLGAFLEEMRRTRGLGPRVVLHLAGTGEYKTRNIRVKGSSLVLYFEPDERRPEPLALAPNDGVTPEGDALIEVDGGSLEMIGAVLRFPDFRLALMPPYALKVRGGDLRLFRCRLTGPLLAAPPGYRGLIRFEGASGEPDGAKPRGLALNETVLVTARSAAHVVGGGSRLRLRQCVLLSTDDGFHFEPGATAKARLDVQCFLEQTTVAARRSAVHLADAPHLQGPVEPIVLEPRFSAFLNPFADAPAPPPLTADGGALARGLLLWEGAGNAFDKRLGHDVGPQAPFARLWGRAWERRQALDVPLRRTLDLTKLDLGRLALSASDVKPPPGAEKRPPPGADFELLGLVKRPAKAPR